jgi:diacylglycerol kinase family enzyme
MPIRIFLNPNCNYGRGLSRWQKIKDKLQSKIGKFEVEEIISPEKMPFQINQAFNHGEKMFIAAGGDGTVNLLLNGLIASGIDIKNTVIGAVGLGSSNDFHKPFKIESFIEQIPVKLDFERAAPRDIIQVNYQASSGETSTCYCLLNCSIGLTAEGNAIFNARKKLITKLQKISVDAAIMVSALTAIFTFKNIICSLKIDNEKEQKIRVSNLGVIKNPHFTGSLCYDTPIQLDDGKLGVNVLMNLSLLERIRALIDLSNHRFQGRPKTKCWLANSLSVRSDNNFSLEIDGEVIKTNSVEFKLIPKAVRCC